ncbi:MAG: F0F1 ATP synthase subunit A [Thermoanaerobaculia bacterium]
MEHEYSILYAPVNKLANSLGLGFEIPDHVIMAALVLLLSFVIFSITSKRLSKENPGGFQHFLEFIVGGIKGMLEDVVGHGAAQKYLYIIGAFAVFIFMGNIFGLLFFLQPPTGNPNTTFALSLTAFAYFNIQGIRKHGLIHYIKTFAGPIWWLAPLMFPIEVIGNLARVLSLGMRLFGNIFGEHTATGIFVGLFPFLLPWPMMALGIFGSTLQAFVFIMMTMVYIGGAVAEEH